MTQAKKPEALRLAELLEKTVTTFGESKRGSRAEAAAELRRLDAENERLRAQLTAQVQETTPLTDERIRQLDDETKFHESHNWSVRFARAVEAAHGIKEPTHGQQT